MSTTGPEKQKAAQIPQAIKVNTEDVQFRRKGALEEEGKLRFDSYILETTAAAGQISRKCAKLRQLTSQAFDFLAMYDVPDNPQDFYGVPTLAEADNTVPVKWQSTNVARVNMQNFLTVRRIPIPDQHKAYIPMTLEECALGWVIRFHPGDARMELIKEGKKRGSKQGTAKADNKAPATTAKAQAAPTTEPEPAAETKDTAK